MSSNPYTFSDNACASQLTNTIDTRLYDRYLPSQMLQPYLNVRPVMTKYSIMPIVDPRKPIHVPMEQQPVYNVNQVFNPGNTQSPWSGFATNINTESELRNQIFALQKCSQAVYVPNSQSDLYHYTFTPSKSANQQQPYPELFSESSFEKFNPNPENLGGNLFNNCTRQQLKDMTENPDCNKVKKNRTAPANTANTPNPNKKYNLK